MAITLTGAGAIMAPLWALTTPDLICYAGFTTTDDHLMLTRTHTRTHTHTRCVLVVAHPCPSPEAPDSHAVRNLSPQRSSPACPRVHQAYLGGHAAHADAMHVSDDATILISTISRTHIPLSS